MGRKTERCPFCGERFGGIRLDGFMRRHYDNCNGMIYIISDGDIFGGVRKRFEFPNATDEYADAICFEAVLDGEEIDRFDNALEAMSVADDTFTAECGSFEVIEGLPMEYT